MVKFENYIFMFGGIQAITKEKNDIYIFSLDKNQWNKIHTTTNSIYDCSPTLKRSSKVTIIPLRKKTLTHSHHKEDHPQNLTEDLLL